MPEKIEKIGPAASVFFRRNVRVARVVEHGKYAFEIERTQKMPWSLAQALKCLGPNNNGSLELPFGLDTLGRFHKVNLFDPLPGLLIGGGAGSGKSNFITTLLASIVLRATPQDIQIQLADVKQVDFPLFERLDTGHVERVESSPSTIEALLADAVEEMESRNRLLSQNNVKKWSDYRRLDPKAPFKLIVIDELADLLISGERSAIEQHLRRLAQKARAAGIALVLCSQHPEAEIVNALISANISNRVAFRLQNYHQSKVVLDETGAEDLQGSGDCLVRLGGGGGVRRLLVPYFDERSEVLLRMAGQKRAEPAVPWERSPNG